MGVAGVILAAEYAGRLDRPKALLDFRGQPFVAQILQALEALEVKLRLVVLGPEAPRIRPALAPYDCLIVETPLAGGATAALRAALAQVQPLQPPAVLVWPVGLPHVRVETIERLLDAYRRTRAPAVVPRFGARRGEPVIWDRVLFAELAEAWATDAAGGVAGGAGGARAARAAVLDRHAHEVVSLSVDDPAVIDELETPEDYERLVRQINRDLY
jgi:CTP:molybdopterin cytidylyltransferase MocA